LGAFISFIEITALKAVYRWRASQSSLSTGEAIKGLQAENFQVTRLITHFMRRQHQIIDGNREAEDRYQREGYEGVHDEFFASLIRLGCCSVSVISVVVIIISMHGHPVSIALVQGVHSMLGGVISIAGAVVNREIPTFSLSIKKREFVAHLGLPQANNFFSQLPRAEVEVYRRC
jgi:hypothetical protein